MALESPIADTLHMASISQQDSLANVSTSEGMREKTIENVRKFFSRPIMGNTLSTIPTNIKSAVDNVLAMANKDNIDATIAAISKIASQDKDTFVQYVSQIKPNGMNLMQEFVQNMPDATVANRIGDFLKQYAPKQTREYIMETVQPADAQSPIPLAVPPKENALETSPMPSEFVPQVFSATSPMPGQAPQTIPATAPMPKQEAEEPGFLQKIMDFFGKPLGLTGGDSYDDKDLTTEQIIEKVINGTLDGGASMISGTRHANRYFDYSVSGGAKKSHDMSREVNDIHDRTVALIKKLMKCTDEEAQTYKSVLYRRVKAEHPELSSKDRALKMEESATKETLKAIDLPAEMKKREIEKSEHPPKEKSEKPEKSEKSEKKIKKNKKDSESSDSFNLSM